jgi:hypothetical protein
MAMAKGSKDEEQAMGTFSFDRCSYGSGGLFPEL